MQTIQGIVVNDTTHTALTSTGGKLDVNAVFTPSGTQDVNLVKVAGAAVNTGHGIAAGSQRVELPSDGTGVIGLNAGSQIIGSLVANQSVNEAQVGGTNIDTNQGSASAGTQRVVLAACKSVKTVVGSINSNTNIVALVAAKKIKVTAYSIMTAYSAGTIAPIFTDGSGGTTLWQFLLQAISGSISGANLAKSSPDCLFATSAGNPLYLNPNGQTVTYSISYFDDDAI